MRLLLLLLSSAPVHAQQPSESAVVQQEVLPELGARAARARARSQAAESWFAGEATFGEAWPRLVGVELLDAGTVRALRRRMAEEARDRAAERIAPLPADDRLAEAVRRARTAALDAEDRFASLQERLLAGVDGALVQAPGLDPTVLRPTTDLLGAALAAAGPEAGPAAEDAASLALEQSEELADLRAAVVRTATVPEADDLAVWARAAVDRPLDGVRVVLLQAAAPLLDPDLQEAVSARVDGELLRITAERVAAREAELEALRGQLGEPVTLGPDDTLESLQEAVAAARAELAASDDDRRPMLELGLALVERRLAMREGQLAEDASVAQRRADAAREAAEATRAAGDQEDQALSALRERLLAVQGAVVEVYDEEAARRLVSEARMEGIRARLDERIEAGANAMARSVLDANRQSSLDRAYLDLRTSVGSLYEELDALRDLQWDHQKDRALREVLAEGWPGGRGSDELILLDDGFREATAGLTEALDSRARTVAATRDEVYRLLVVARENRRTLRQAASNAARAQARRDFFPELVREVGALPGQLGAGLRGLAVSLLGVPMFLADVDALWAFVYGSFELFVLVGLWGVTRRQVPAAVHRALDALDERAGRAVEGERTRTVDQLTRLGRTLLDASTALFVFWILGRGVGAVGFLVLLWLGWSSLKAAPLLARSLLANPEDVHPSLRLVTAPTEALAARTAWWLVAWAVGSRIGTYTMVELLDADRLRDVVATFSSLAFWALLLAFLFAWGPVAVQTLARQAEHSVVTEWITRGQGTGLVARIVNLPRYALGVVVVFSQLTIHLFGRLVEGRAGLGWLQAALARRQIRSDGDTEVLRELPAVVVEAVRGAGLRGVGRVSVRDRLKAAHDAWTSSGRRGLVSLIGDVGSGKAQALRRLEPLLGMPTRILEVERRSTDAADVVAFLASRLDLEADTVDGLVEGLLESEPMVIAVDRSHFLFLRCVRGYAPLQTLIGIMTATAERHFWVLAVHEPSWDYLTGIAARLNLDAFQDHIRLEAVTGPDLAAWLEGAVTDAGHQVSYDGLATTGLLGGDEGLAERRARTAFWRLLFDASGGIPANALDLWRSSLSLREDGSVEVHMFKAPSADDIQHLSDDLLFSLKALVQHERLTSDELARVLNRRPAAARSSARTLVHLDLAAYRAADQTYALPALWSPAVKRLLRQKHFLYAE